MSTSQKVVTDNKQQKIKTLAEEFQNVYALSKTLRFELKPVKETQEILETERQDRKNFKKDRKIAKSYKKLKVLLDELHQEFIQDVINDFNFDLKELEEFEKAYLEFLDFKDKDNYKKKQKLRNIYEKSAKDLASEISKAFKKYNKEKYGSKFTLKNLLGEKVFDYLENKYKNDTYNLNVIRTFKFKPTQEEKKQGKRAVNFSTYLGGFNQNRENFYKDEMKAGQFATRTTENLIQFIKNKKVFDDKYKDKHHKLGFTDEQIEIFSLDYFNNLFLQDGLDTYNGILGNAKGEKNDANEGLNQKINIYKQKEKTRIKQEGGKFNKSDYPLFKELYKQIGSIKKDNDVYVEILNDEELVETANSLPNKIKAPLSKTKEFYNRFFNSVKNNEYDLDKIYLPKSVGTFFSQLVFSDWNKLAFVYNKRWVNENVPLKEGEEINVQYRTLADIKKRFEELEENSESFVFAKTYKKALGLEKEITNADEAWNKFWEIIQHHIDTQFAGGEKTVFDKNKKTNVEEKFENLEILKEKYLKAIKKYKKKMVDSDDGLDDDEENKIKADIKNYLDRVKEIERIAKYFDLRKYFNDIDEADKDSDFYLGYTLLLDDVADAKINDYYNAFRNYLTKANVIDEKIKLNFGSGSLLNGWPITMEEQKLGVIFRDNRKYYLGILNKRFNNILNKEKHPDIFIDDNSFEKMEYKQIADVSKEIQNLMVIDNKTVKKNGSKKPEQIEKFFENLGIPKEEVDKIRKENKVLEYSKNKYLPKNINRIRKTKSYSISSENFSRNDLNRFIDFYKERIIEYKKGIFEFTFKNTPEYESFKDFTDHIASQDYKIKFVGIDKNYIDQKVVNGELYLFEIHNKDWNLKDGKQKTGSKNLHTIYFEELFSDENIKNPVFKLSGGAEVFFRDAIEKKKQKKKKDKNGNYIKTKKGDDVLDKPRFTKNKILFHTPIEINYGTGNTNQGKFNQKINQFIARSQNVKIIGIDRGEKHLLYYSLIDLDGKIIKSESLNKIKIGGKEVDFHQKLDEAEKERQKSRKSWQKIDQIKNLKAGYISHVVKKIVDLAIENNAVIVLEDLNFGFKSFRQKIEKNVYQQFEKALIDKLGFVVNKQKQNQRFAPQLSAPFESFEKVGKQIGIIYYVLANNTSKVCPQCQWRKNIYPHYSGKKTIGKLKNQYQLSMKWLESENRFVFEYKGEGDKEKVSVYSDVDRVRYDKNLNNSQGGYHIYNHSSSNESKDGRNIIEKSITLKLKELLWDKFSIKELEGELITEIINKTDEVSADDIKDLIGLFNAILNIRNTVIENNDDNSEVDYIQCPACGFDTRKENDLGIKNGDDNGAYNIALRGLFLLKRKNGIFNCIDNENNYQKPKLTFKNTDYFQWVNKII